MLQLSKRPYLILFILILFHIVNNSIWLGLDTTPAAWDQASHLNFSLDYWEVLRNFFTNPWWRILDVSHFYPPLIHIFSIPFTTLFPVNQSADWPVISLTFFWILTLWSVYKIGEHLSSVKTGLVAVTLLSLFNFWVNMSRQFLLDIPLTAFITLAIYLLLKTERFTNRFYAVLFTVCCGLGMLTRWNFAFFVFPLVIATIFVKSPNQYPTKKFSWWCIRLALLLLIFFAIAGPWYLWNFANMFRGFSNNMQVAVREGDPPIFSFASWIYYITTLSHQIGLIFFIAFIILLILALVSKNYRQKLIFVLAWFFSAYVIMSLIRNKDPRYTFPYLPAVALIIATVLTEHKSRIIKNIVTTILIIFGFIQYFVYSYAPPNSRPQKVDWQIEQVIQKIVSDLSQNEQPGLSSKLVKVTVFSDHRSFHPGIFQYMVRRLNLKQLQFELYRFPEDLGEFLVYKTGYRDNYFKTPEREKFAQLIEQGLPQFIELARFPLPDGSTATIFKRKYYPLTVTKNMVEQKIQRAGYRQIEYFTNLINLNCIVKFRSRKELQYGRFEQIIFTADKAMIDKVKIKNPKVIFNNVIVDLFQLFNNNQVVIISANSISPEFQISVTDLDAALKESIRGYDNIQLNKEGILIQGHFGNRNKLPWSGLIKIKLSYDKKYIFPSIKWLKIGWFTLPGPILNTFLSRPLSLHTRGKLNSEIKADEIQLNTSGIYIIQSKE